MIKLGRLLSQFSRIGKKEGRALLEAGAVLVNGEVVRDASQLIGYFDRVECEGETVQGRSRRLLMLHKPAGHVSATVDSEHPTVIDLIDEPWKSELHLAGRLDRFTTGLVILTNDSGFSEALTEPGRQVAKGYKVETDREIPDEAVAAIRAGMRFEKEDVTTQPARIQLEGGRACDLTIYEGKHHQVKRMFLRFGIKVVALHRYRIGKVVLDSKLGPGEYRELREEEWSMP
ncbi:pseudouridine synthase [Haloferula sp.]|uniref:pseudouridine synthase n=1 Tax=Haloferula sp. TaxID=2497595 RepID=UPI00329E75B4